MPELPTNPEMPVVKGYIIDDDDMHWQVSCPKCDNVIEYTGFFDSSDLNRCKCGTVFKTNEIIPQ